MKKLIYKLKKISRKVFNNNGIFIGLVLAISIVYLLSIFGSGYFKTKEFDSLRNMLTTWFAIISAISFWMQFKNSERLNESSFVMNLNYQFINKKELTKIEHKLEKYFYKYEEEKKNLKRNLSINELKNINLDIDFDRSNEECQDLINYLAYFEAIAVMVKNGTVMIEDINDLFYYRFFIAVNNPEVQQNELFPSNPYYRGIFYLDEKWSDIMKYDQKEEYIPLKEFAVKTEFEKWKETHK